MTPDAIRAGLAPLLAGLPPEERLQALVEGLYARRGALAEIHGRLPEAAERIPRDIIRLTALSESAAPDPVAILALTAGFAVLTEAEDGLAWLHFQLAMQLRGAVRRGVEAARWPALTHAALSLERGALTDVAQTEMRTVLAELLVDSLPSESLRNALASVRMDRVEQARSVRAAIEAHAADLRVELTLRHELETAGVLLRPFSDAEMAELPTPAGDAEHYIFAERRLRRPAIDVLDLEYGFVSYDTTRPGGTEFYVFNRREELIRALSYGDAPFIERPVTKLETVVGFADDRFSEINVAHFLLDKLPREAIYRAVLGEAPRLLLLRTGPYYEEVLRLAGVAEAPLVPEGQRGTFRIRRLLVSTNVSRAFHHPAQFGAPWAIQDLRRRLPAGVEPGARRLFISRRDARVRRVLNQAELDPVLDAFGFESHELAGLSVGEQMRLFGEASHVVGLHGAGLTNLLFAPPSTRVLEILPALCASITYWVLAAALAQPYSALIADDPERARPDYATWRHDPALNMRDVTVDPERLRQALARLTGP